MSRHPGPAVFRGSSINVRFSSYIVQGPTTLLLRLEAVSRSLCRAERLGHQAGDGSAVGHRPDPDAFRRFHLNAICSKAVGAMPRDPSPPEPMPQTGASEPTGRSVAGRPRRDKDFAESSGSRADILRVARDEFARAGFSGGRIDAIADLTRTSKRMIYYHFGSKKGLYLAVLEQAYEDIRARESGQEITRLPPLDAMRRLVELTFDYDEAHPDFVRLVSIENIHNARHLKSSAVLNALNGSVIEVLRQVLASGHRGGVFRGDVDPIDVHMLISSLCFFRVSNQHTFGAIFGRDLMAPETRARHRTLTVDVVLRYLAPPGGDGAGSPDPAHG